VKLAQEEDSELILHQKEKQPAEWLQMSVIAPHENPKGNL